MGEVIWLGEKEVEPEEGEIDTETVTTEYAEFFNEWSELNKQAYWDRVQDLRQQIKETE